MKEKSEVQNLTEPTVASEPLDASPLAAEADQVEDGAPKDYPQDVRGADGEPYPERERPETWPPEDRGNAGQERPPR